MAFKTKLYWNSWRGSYVFFFNLGHSSLIPTLRPMAFSVGGWVRRVGDGGGRGVCAPPLFSHQLFRMPQRHSPFYGFNKSQHPCRDVPPPTPTLTWLFLLLRLSPLPTSSPEPLRAKKFWKGRAIGRTSGCHGGPPGLS